MHSLVDVDTQLDNLRRWKDAGRVRYIGITHSRVSAFDALERLMRNVKLDFVQLNYSFTEPDAEPPRADGYDGVLLQPHWARQLAEALEPTSC